MKSGILNQFYKRVVFLSESPYGFLEHTDVMHVTSMLSAVADTVPTMFVGERDLAGPDILADDVTDNIRLLLCTNVIKWKPEKILAVLEKCPNVVICIVSPIPLSQLDVNKFSAFSAPEEDGWPGFFMDLRMELTDYEKWRVSYFLETVAHLYLAPGLVNYLETHDGGILATSERIDSLGEEAGDLLVQFLREEIKPDKNHYYVKMLGEANDFVGSEKPPIGMESFKKWIKEYARLAKLRLVETQTNDGERFRFEPMRLK